MPSLSTDFKTELVRLTDVLRANPCVYCPIELSLNNVIQCNAWIYTEVDLCFICVPFAHLTLPKPKLLTLLGRVDFSPRKSNIAAPLHTMLAGAACSFQSVVSRLYSMAVPLLMPTRESMPLYVSQAGGNGERRGLDLPSVSVTNHTIQRQVDFVRQGHYRRNSLAGVWNSLRMSCRRCDVWVQYWILWPQRSKRVRNVLECVKWRELPRLIANILIEVAHKSVTPTKFSRRSILGTQRSQSPWLPSYTMSPNTLQRRFFRPRPSLPSIGPSVEARRITQCVQTSRDIAWAMRRIWCIPTHPLIPMTGRQ